jgi:hypothetical protein
LFLAPSCSLQENHDTQDKSPILEKQISDKHGARSERAAAIEIARLVGTDDLGVPNKKPPKDR